LINKALVVGEPILGNNPAMVVDGVLGCNIHWGEVETRDLVDLVQWKRESVAVSHVFGAEGSEQVGF
jgi:hypothetical protein